MNKKKPCKQPLQLALMTLLLIVSAMLMASESFAALQCYNCHGNGTTSALPLDTPPGSPVSYRNITTGAFKGNHQNHLNGVIVTAANQDMCARCHNNSGYTPSHRNGKISLKKGMNFSTNGTYTSPNLTDAVTYVFKNQTSVPSLGTCATVNCHFESVTPVWGADPATVTCDTCHLSQPTTGSHTKHVTQYGGSASCIKCHAARPNFQHASSAGNTGRNIDLSQLPAGAYTGSTFQFLPSQSATRQFGQCDTVYCHSSGQGPGGTATVTYAASPPVWGNSGSSGCGTCHDTNLINTGSHGKHVAKDSNCGNCHTGATLATMNSATHADGLIDVNGTLAVGYSQGLSSARGNGYGTCSNATCHSATTGTPLVSPLWGQAATCASCHDTTPVTGSHPKHTASIACGTCHTGAVSGSNGGTGHGNGTIDVAQGYPANIAKHAVGSYTGTCSTSCHNAYSTTVGIATPTWGQTDTCASCHAASPLTGAHAKHVAHTNVTCAGCHTNPGGTGHVDGNVSVSVGGYPTTIAKHASGSGYGSCSNVSCHNGGNGANAFIAPAVSFGSSLNCAGCHGYPPANANHSGVVAGTCNNCHSNVVAGGSVTSSTFVNLQLHMNGSVEGGKCDSCHGYPPVRSMVGMGINSSYSSAKLQNYSGGGGVHNVAGHLPLTLKASQGLAFAGCISCHPSDKHNQGSGSYLTANVQVVVDPKYKFDKNRPIVYDAKQSGTGKTTGKCSNVSCHFQKSPNWSSEAYTQRY